MSVGFDEEKATQAAVRFLQLRQAPMSYMKLLKLLYMADRAALLRWGKTITMDAYVSMRHGPVLSTVYNLINEDREPSRKSFWREHISPPENYEVHLLGDAPSNRLSDAEEKIIDEVFKQYGTYSRWDLVEHLHKVLPEWKDPGSSSTKIEISDILRSEIDDEVAIGEIEAELRALTANSSVLSSYSR